VSVRVARSRRLVAEGYALATVARVTQISRQALYRTPTPRQPPQRRPPADLVEKAIVEEATANQTDGYRMVCAFVRQRLGVPVNRRQRCAEPGRIYRNRRKPRPDVSTQAGSRSRPARAEDIDQMVTRLKASHADLKASGAESTFVAGGSIVDVVGDYSDALLTGVRSCLGAG
jgi:hypothetical protein